MSAIVSYDSDSDVQHESDSEDALPERQAVDDLKIDAAELTKGVDNVPTSISPPENPITVGRRHTQPHQSSSTATRTVPIALEGNSFVEEPTYLTRPNRYFGPDSTWLSWTEEDRLVSESLDRTRAQDLGLHLYNAHILSLQAERAVDVRRKRLKGKGRATEAEELDADEVKSLNLPRGWTRWPLPPDAVPREPLVPQTSRNHVYRMPEDLRPSANLEDCIIATTTRIARGHWESRDWQLEFIDQKRDMKVEHDEHDDAMQEGPCDFEVEQSEAEETMSSDSEPDGEVFTSQAYHTLFGDGSGGSKDIKTIDDGSMPLQRPVPIADDEKARRLLLPGTRQILSKLDDLLLGLHKARQSYANNTLRRARKLVPEVATHATTDNESDYEQAEVSRKGRKRKRSVSVVSTGSSVSNTADVDETRKRKPKTRDWSDVMGMAALTGWDPAVVERASQRCASLFGETMLFRTFHEGDINTKQPSHFTEHRAASDEDMSDSEDEELNAASIIRTSEACDECRSQREKCEPLGSAEDSTSCKRCAKHLMKCSGIRVKVSANIGTLCPYPECDRHSDPFRKSYGLRRHLKTVHKHDAPPYPAIPDRTLGVAEQQSSAIVCPVTACPRHRQPFSRGTKLYEHLRKMHPEVDIQEMKRLEAVRRGDRRGRYRDESRRREVGYVNRSRSKSVVSRAGSEVTS